MNQKQTAEDIFRETLNAVRPEQILPQYLSVQSGKDKLTAGSHQFDISGSRPVYIIGTGKAAVTMATATADILGDCLKGGMLITHSGQNQSIPGVTILEGSHPLPDQKSLKASQRLLEFIKSIPENAIVLNLVSGGTSSLFCLPADDLSIEDIQNTYRLLISSGAAIHEMNRVRKVLSQVKGGQLLQHLSGTTLIDLVISDVPDNDLRMVGSGPSIAQEISALNAFEITKQCGIYKKLPHSVRTRLAKMMEEERKSGSPQNTTDIDRHYTLLIASAKQMAEEACETAESHRFRTMLNEQSWSGPIAELTELIIENIDSHPGTNKTALIFFGECTVEVTGDGKGGRNQELALRMAFELQKEKYAGREITFLSAGTDGIDGPTDAAGAVVDRDTISEAEEIGLDPHRFLENNDSYHFFERAGGHIKTGPSGNNLMDLQVVLISN